MILVDEIQQLRDRLLGEIAELRRDLLAVWPTEAEVMVQQFAEGLAAKVVEGLAPRIAEIEARLERLEKYIK